MSHWPCSINLNDSKEKIKKSKKVIHWFYNQEKKQWTNASQVITVKMYRGTRIYPQEFEKFLVWNFWIVPFSKKCWWNEFWKNGGENSGQNWVLFVCENFIE